MDELSAPELYKTTKTTEGSQAQARIVQDLFEGRGLKVDTAQTQLEGYYGEFLVKHGRAAYQELVDVVGLNADKLSPVKEAETVQLGADDKRKLTDYLLDRNHEWIKEFAGDDLFGSGKANTEMLETMLALAGAFHRIEPNEFDVEITGPIIRMTFKSIKAYRRFADSLNSAGSVGLFFPLPLREDNEGERVYSSNTFINLVSPDETIGKEESVNQHEKYHAVDYFRQEQLKKIANDNPKNSSIRTTLSETDKFRERLKEFFFDPDLFVQALSVLRSQAPEAYDCFCGLGVIGSLEDFPFLRKALVASFLSIQKEVPAFIAGFLNSKNDVPFTDWQKNEIIKRLLKFYMPLGKVQVGDLEARSTRNEDGKLIVDETRIDEDMQKQAQEKGKEKERMRKVNRLIKKINDPIKGQAALDEMNKLFPDKREQQQLDMLNHYEGKKNLYVRDVQRLIDFFLNERGQGYETVEQIKRNLSDAMDAYRNLAALRGNPYQALIEISPIPLSHWVVYSRRQEELR